MSVKEKAEQLGTALGNVTVADKKARFYTDPGAVIDPPAIVLGPPTLNWEAAYCPGEATSATWPIFAVTTADDRALEKLYDFVPAVAAAAETVEDVVTTGASPGVYRSGEVNLPCYQIDAEASL